MGKKTVCAILLWSLLTLTLCGCGETPGRGGSDENRVILGSNTALTGDFRWPGFGSSSAGAADQDVNRLITGYAVMETDRNGAYVWNETAVRSHSERETEEGNLEITVEIFPNLRFSDGTEVKAVHYLAYLLAFSSPVSEEASHTGRAGQAFVGFEEFRLYNGANGGQSVGEGAAAKIADPCFAGLRLLGDYRFSMTVDGGRGYYPYYYANTYGAVTPYDLRLTLGEGVEVRDDGEGAYLTAPFYERTADGAFSRASHLRRARYDWQIYPVSGAYTVSEWNEGSGEAILRRNPCFAGNFEGQTPSVETVVYTRIVAETQLDRLRSGAVDILSGISGGEDTRAALNLLDSSHGKFRESHYQRAGYGKLQFECDFGPTMFPSVRRAVAYVLNTDEFCSAYTGGYGTIVYGPYSPDFSMWQAISEEIELTDYAFSVENARRELVDGGWIYNADGTPYSGAGVRYKKLTPAEAETCDGVNKTYRSVANTDGVTYRTELVNGSYYLPCVINYFGTADNPVTDLLVSRLIGSQTLRDVGMVVRHTVGEWTPMLGEIYRESSYGYGGTPTYGMFNLATGWSNAVYDDSFRWSHDPAWFGNSANKLYDEYDKAFPYYNAQGKHLPMSFEEAMEASGGRLGMDYLSMAMVYDARTEQEYNQWWGAYLQRWNQLLPDIPLYSNYYFDIYSSRLQNFDTGPFWSAVDALLYCTVV